MIILHTNAIYKYLKHTKFHTYVHEFLNEWNGLINHLVTTCKWQDKSSVQRA